MEVVTPREGHQTRFTGATRVRVPRCEETGNPRESPWEGGPVVSRLTRERPSGTGRVVPRLHWRVRSVVRGVGVGRVLVNEKF